MCPSEAESRGGDRRTAIRRATIEPAPTPEEVAAIVAAYEALWPRPATGIDPAPAPPWRWSGRWWVGPRRWGGWT